MLVTCYILCVFVFFFFKQKTAYEMRISDWSSDVCSSDLRVRRGSIARYVMRTLERKRTGEKGTHLSSARPVVTFVERDMSYPSAEGAIPIIAIERREAGDEGFLRQVHRLVGIADLPHAEPIKDRQSTRLNSSP